MTWHPCKTPRIHPDGPTDWCSRPAGHDGDHGCWTYGRATTVVDACICTACENVMLRKRIAELEEDRR